MKQSILPAVFLLTFLGGTAFGIARMRYLSALQNWGKVKAVFPGRFDADRISEALSCLKNGGAVEVGGGTFMVTEPIDIPRWTSIEGAGREDTMFVFQGSIDEHARPIFRNLSPQQ